VYIIETEIKKKSHKQKKKISILLPCNNRSAPKTIKKNLKKGKLSPHRDISIMEHNT